MVSVPMAGCPIVWSARRRNYRRSSWVRIPDQSRCGTGTCIEWLDRAREESPRKPSLVSNLRLWDIKAKALGVPVYELVGGPTRTRQRVYWSHCGSSRAGNWEIIGVPPLRTWNDVTALGKEVVERGFTALKTNIIYPGEQSHAPIDQDLAEAKELRMARSPTPC